MGIGRWKDEPIAGLIDSLQRADLVEASEVMGKMCITNDVNLSASQCML